MQTFEVAAFIDPVPHGLDNYWLVKKDEFAQEAAPTLYDISIDAKRALTQADADSLVLHASSGIKLREGLKTLLGTSDAPVEAAALRSLLGPE